MYALYSDHVRLVGNEGMQDGGTAKRTIYHYVQ